MDGAGRRVLVIMDRTNFIRLFIHINWIGICMSKSAKPMLNIHMFNPWHQVQPGNRLPEIVNAHA